jgi:hypothetical protein
MPSGALATGPGRLRCDERATRRATGEVELESVRADLTAVIHDTVHPAHASVWLRGGRR